MNITDVRVRLLDTDSRLRAVCSITLDDEIVIHDIRIIESEEGLFFAMPSKKLKNGSYRDICHPINQEARSELEETIFNAYHEEVGREVEEGFHDTNPTDEDNVPTDEVDELAF